uniref:diphosphoinositol-polyphosphate diphosphatase n=1 Tax=Ditylenchus dipsaci TaxID=166011 RepID=A0A915EQZ8_9BILA
MCSSAHNISPSAVSQEPSPASQTSNGKTAEGKRIRDGDGYRQRAAALCVRLVDRPGEKDQLQILLVSGRGQKNYWVLPGGGVEGGENTEQAVLREFKEEAGIQGSILAVVGEFTNNDRFHHTTLFMLSAIEIFDDWEDNQYGRQRCWMNTQQAMERIKQSQREMICHGILNARQILLAKQVKQ